MMKFRLVANNSKAIHPELVLSEKVWRPVRSLMAIANQRILEKKGSKVVEFEELQDLDHNAGYGLDNDCASTLAEEMELLIDDPFTIVDYGMTVDITGGEEFLTYPVHMATEYFEEVGTGKFYASLQDENIIGKRVQSHLRAQKSEVLEVINFMKLSDGFQMP
jgi:hypothetical protein